MSFATALPLVAAATCGALALLYLCLRHPLLAAMTVIVTTFFRTALPNVGLDLYMIFFAVMVVSMGLWLYREGEGSLRITVIEIAMLFYVAWCVASMIAPHPYPPVTYPLNGEQIEIPRYIVTSTILPFSMFIMGRNIGVEYKAVRAFCWMIIAVTAYSVWVSVAQFYAPALVWPRYIIDSPNWAGRANGVMNQPVENGMVLCIGLVVAIVLVKYSAESRWAKGFLWFLIGVIPFAIFLTRTRASYLNLVLLIVLGCIYARGFKAPFVTFLGGLVAAVAVMWPSLTSSDRSAGGVGSVSEVNDRLNIMATALWGFGEKPIFGWGIGRFVAMNTYHHQQWSKDVPWINGYGIASHFNELGILAELGIIGLAIWLVYLASVTLHVLRAVMRLPEGNLLGLPIAFAGLSALVSLVLNGVTVDLRLLGFAPVMAMLVIGMGVGAYDRHKDMTASVSTWRTIQGEHGRAASELRVG